MDFTVDYLSFFVIQLEGVDGQSSKHYKHYQTLDRDDYEDSEIKGFLDAELKRTAKRKVEKHPSTEQAPTKIGRFIVEPGHDLTSNPNYNLFMRLASAGNKESFLDFCDELVRDYLETSAVRGGALIIVRARLTKYFDEPFLFVLKCDFESNIVRITDERSLIGQVEMAINARNIKSIQYPHMPEEGMREEWELKIHQSSHARYFEDFLKFVYYEKSMPEIVTDQVMGMVQEYIEQKWQEPEHEERKKVEQDIELWAASEKRELQEKWDHGQVREAAARMIEYQPELEMKFKVNDIMVRAKLADYGDKLHISKLNGRYVVLIEGDSLLFDKGFSPVELLEPEDLHQVIDRVQTKSWNGEEEDAGQPATPETAEDDAPPW
ncbi:DUF3900 domain-containing protein [Paenibacillus aurantius]|uniref:DUF3900 domain-containing protein n=1 Tax=Paenibacillus aurantius TaxID=2918900 RepID=A0AA96LM99_9BACL|nr:DUF3900 domain-containing protein [Paenibacillus aurantius]WNQ13817.1 DUF3900 domain-containing protein [Paenibacillus aurantius]